MAIEIAEAVVGALKGELAATAVNAPMVAAEVSQTFLILAYSLVCFRICYILFIMYVIFALCYDICFKVHSISKHIFYYACFL